MADSNKTQGTTPENQQGTTPENQQGTTPENQQGSTPKKTKNAAEKLVSVFIPKQSRGDTERFVAVNGERILVQTGKQVEIPERFAEVIKNSEEMSAVAEKYIEDNMSTLS